MKLTGKIKPVYLWFFAGIAFLAFTAIITYWYPVSSDESVHWKNPVTLKVFKNAYHSIVPRISVFFAFPIFNLGKWFFVLANSFVQFANCLCIFYILFLRLPNIKNLKDMPYFLMIIFMSIFFVCRPSETIFWLSGAINYSWLILFFLLMLCFLRIVQAQKNIFKDNWIFKIILLILGFIIGLSNECLAPIALGFSVCFALFCEYKKIQTPRALSFLIFGLALGCLVFFTAPAHYNKMVFGETSNLSSVSLSRKLFFHLYHFNEFFKALMLLPVVTALFTLIAFADRDIKANKENLYFSLLFLLLSFLTAFILFVVPDPPMRAYYSASVLSVLAFLFLVKYYITAYNFDFSKILCYIIICISLYLMPGFVLPHYSLHLQEQIRFFEIKQKMKATPYYVLKGPTQNLTISFMDVVNQEPIGNGLAVTKSTTPINW